MAFGCSFLWNVKSPSDPLSSKTWIIFHFVTILLLDLGLPYFLVLLVGISTGPALTTATMELTPHGSCLRECFCCSKKLYKLLSSGVVLSRSAGL